MPRYLFLHHWLRARREERGWSRDTLAARSGLSRSTIQRHESPAINDPHYDLERRRDTVERLARGLNDVRGGLTLPYVAPMSLVRQIDADRSASDPANADLALRDFPDGESGHLVVGSLRDAAYTVDLHAAQRVELPQPDAELADALRQATEVRVLWSERSRRDPAMVRFWNVLAEVEAHHAIRVRVMHVDHTPSPPEAQRGLASPSWWVAGATGAVWLLMLLDRGQVLPVLGPISRCGFAWLLGLGMAICAAQVFRSELAPRTRELAALATFLSEADLIRILRRAEAVMRRLFGISPLSPRVVMLSIGLGLVPAWVLGWIWGGSVSGFVPSTGATGVRGWGTGLAAVAFAVVPLFLTNLLTDLFSWWFTRSMLRRVARLDPVTPRWIWLVLGADLAVLAGCAVVAMHGNFLEAFAFVEVTAWPLSWVRVVASHAALLVLGELRIAALATDPLSAGILGSGYAALTAALPSAIHIGLLSIAGLSWLFDHAPLRWTARALKMVANTKRQPWTIGYPALVIASVSALVLWPRPVHRAEPRTAPFDVDALGWALIPDFEPGERPCYVGCDDATGECERPAQWPVLEGWRVIWSTLYSAETIPSAFRLGRCVTYCDNEPFEILAGEVDQRTWAAVASRAPGTYGLSVTPSLFVGDDLPVTNVSWCDAARFANALTEQTLGRSTTRRPATVYYTRFDEHAEDPTLTGCESGRVVFQDVRRAGYRLPTSHEWEHALRVGVDPATSGIYWTGNDPEAILAAEWLFHSPRRDWLLRPHPAGWGPGRRHPANHWNMPGNVEEWTGSAVGSSMAEPACGPPSSLVGRRIVRGGTLFSSEQFARMAFATYWGPAFRFSWRGFRLVRPHAER